MTHYQFRSLAHIKPRNTIKRVKMEEPIYEHKVLSVKRLRDIKKTLDDMSINGWILVSVVEDRHYFKRLTPHKKVL